MLNAIIRASLEHRLLTLGLASLLVIYGLIALAELPVDVFPDLNRPTVTINVEAGGLAPEEVESLVVRPIETALNGASGVQRVRSSAGIGIAVINVEFGWGTDIYVARQLVTERLAGAEAQLPEGVEAHIAAISSIMGQIMLIGLAAEPGGPDPMALRELADWTIRPALQGVPGVAQVIVMGGEVRQYQVQLLPERMVAHGITLTEVREALEAANATAAGGFLEQGSKELLVRGLGRITALEDLRQAVVAERGGHPITLGQVARVEFGPAQKRGDAGVNGKPGVILVIHKQPGADTVAITERIDHMLDGLAPTLPPGVEIARDLFRQATFIEAAIGNVEEALRDGVILVAIVLILFLLNFRTTAITLTAIPLSILATVVVFKALGMGVNTMTLGGLAVAIGELVDDAIVDVENVHRRLKENRFAPNPKPVLQVVFEASSEVRNSIVYATVIIGLVFLPLFFLAGLEGKLFQPLGVAYLIALASSLLVSLTVTPVLASYLLPRLKFQSADQEGPLVRWLKRLDLHLLRWTLRNPNAVLVAALALVLISFSLIPLMGREFLPRFNEGAATIDLFAEPGTSITASTAIGQYAEEILNAIPNVGSLGRRTGRAEEDEHAEAPSFTEFEVIIEEGRPREHVFNDIRARLATIPGVEVEIGQPISHRLDHILSGVQAQIAVKLYGDDLAVLRTKADEIREAMKGIPGIIDLYVERQKPIPQLQITLDRAAAARHGIPAAQLTEDLEIALAQHPVGQVLEGQRAYDLVAMVAPEARQDPAALGDLLIGGAESPAVPLRLLASIIPTAGPNLIHHEDLRRRIVISANVQDRDLGATVADVEKAVAGVDLPPGYQVRFEGQFEAQRSAARIITTLTILSLLAIFLLLYSHFGLARVALQIMSNLPLAVVGGVIAVFLTGGIMSIATMVGFITVFGIASRNGIMMISHYIHLMEHEGEGFTEQMIIRGSLERLVPVLMTALTAILGLIPLALAAGEPGKELLQPIAVVILGGLCSSTLLDMAVTPALFWKYGRPVYERILARRAAGAEPITPTGPVPVPAE
ncbi:MAG TPA: efflux RND transporter permease subunit [bacterium]|nr:efflux RND transporter permease subunit [bacterium]